MQKKFNHIDDLLADSYFIEWLCDPTEESDAYWSAQSEINPNLRTLIPFAKNTFNNITVEANEVSNTLVDTALNEMHRTGKVRIFNFKTAAFLKIAAVLLFFSLAAIYTLLPKNEFSTEYGKTMAVDLKDGSEVILNANSKLSLTNNKGKAIDRQVWVSGEAYFNVLSNPKSPFTVHTSRGDIIVLGTIFNVEDTPESFSIYLEEGRIKFVPKPEYQKQSIELDVKKRLIFSSSNERFELQDNNDPNITAWKEKKIVCQNMPLSELSKEIEAYYGVDVVLKQDALADRELDGILENKSLDELLLIVCEALDIKVISSKNSIEFSYY